MMHPSGGMLLATDTSFTTGFISTNTTYLGEQL